MPNHARSMRSALTFSASTGSMATVSSAHAASAGRDDRGALLEAGHDAGLAVGKRHVGNEIAFDVGLRDSLGADRLEVLDAGCRLFARRGDFRLAVGGASRRTPGPSCGGA